MMAISEASAISVISYGKQPLMIDRLGGKWSGNVPVLRSVSDRLNIAYWSLDSQASETKEIEMEVLDYQDCL